MSNRVLIRLLILAVTIPALAAFAFCQVNQERNEKLHADFHGYYKNLTIDVLEQHFLADTKCELKRVMPTLRLMVFTISDVNHGVVAWAYPDEKEEYTVRNPPRVFIYSGHRWNAIHAILINIHEALHLTKNEERRYICGPDRMKSPAPVCMLFGVRVYSSREINAVLKDHLEKFNAWDDIQ